MNLKPYTYSSEQSQATEKRILEVFNALPYSDQLHFLSEIFENAEYLFMSSGVSAISHGLFNREMSLRSSTLSEEILEKSDLLYSLEQKLENIGKILFEISSAETKKRYDSLALKNQISPTSISQN
jgi:hypothetical protein